MSKPKTCALCEGKPTLRVVGTKEFCKKHVPDAFDAMRKIGYKNESFATK